MMIGNDLTTQAIEWALKGLERRSQVSANNIANAETPGFRASAVDVRLEDELVGMIQTNLRKSAMVEAFNYKAGLLRTALRTQ
jgi:flagellar basal body rod protein FlgG